MNQFRGRLFAGKLFAGKLFREPLLRVPAGRPGMTGPRKRTRRQRKDEETLILLL